MSNIVNDTTIRNWTAPDLTSSDDRISSKALPIPKLPTANEVENIYKQAYDEGLSKGYTEGANKALSENKNKIDVLNSMIRLLRKPLDSLNDNMIKNVRLLSMTIASQIIRREISIDSSHVISAVNKSIDMLNNVSDRYTIILNPTDIPVVKELLSLNNESTINIKEDPSITRGGCKIESSISMVDATIDEQLRVIASEIIGGSRIDDP